MTKSIYVSPLNFNGIEKSNANHLIVSEHGLSQDNWKVLSDLGVELSIAIDAFGKVDCPANPDLQNLLFEKIKNSLDYNPQEIWLDGFRFGGDCTGINEKDNIGLEHIECRYCKGIDRVQCLTNLIREVHDRINRRAELGLFVVAFKAEDSLQTLVSTGLDYKRLGKFFDLTSPMLYHHMLAKPVGYISEYVGWIYDVTKKPVLPIIQIKDMPDDLEDKITEEEILAAAREAVKSPSSGVAIFWWNHALEKNKTTVVSRVLSSL